MADVANPNGSESGAASPKDGCAPEKLAEMEMNYPHFRRFVYDKLRDEFSKALPELPDDVDLEILAQQEGGQPLEAFIDQLEPRASLLQRSPLTL